MLYYNRFFFVLLLGCQGEAGLKKDRGAGDEGESYGGLKKHTKCPALCPHNRCSGLCKNKITKRVQRSTRKGKKMLLGNI